MKENDWIVANLENPDMNPGQFRTLGMSTNDTQLLSKDQYLKSDYIKNNDAFKDDSGNFSEKKFTDFYNNKLDQFKLFSDIDSGFQYDMFDFRRFDSKNANVKDPNLTLTKVLNPDEETVGYGWINQKQESPLSVRELVEKNQIYDTKSGKFLDYSPNDHALFSNPIEWFKDIIKEPLVLATYDEDSDEINPLTGRPIKKGDKKINSDGKYYYETLNGRSIADKEILSGWDTLTVEGTNLNKYDFFDSDDKEKSIGGILMNRAVSLAPMFIGGPVGTAYGALLVGRELLKTLPAIDGIFGAITNSDTPFTRIANNLAGWATAGNMSMSDYGKSSLLTFESITNTLADVALQWQQQRIVAEAIQKLSGAKALQKGAEASAKALYDKEVPTIKQKYLNDIAKYKQAGEMTKVAELEKAMHDAIEVNWKESTIGKGYLTQAMQKVFPKIAQANKLGNDLSLWYMVMVSNNDVYADMLEQGLTKREALAVTLGSTLGMYKIDTSGLGEVFFKQLATDGERAIRATLRDRSKEWTEAIAKYTKKLKETDSKKRFANIFAKANELGSKMFTKFWDDIKHHTGGFITKATGEGLEEVGEEFASDISKQIYELIHDIKPLNNLFGGLTTDNVGAFSDFTNNDNTFPELFQRYAGSFMGGFLGGGVFYGKEIFDNNNWHRDEHLNKLQHVVREFGVDESLRVLDKYHKEGKLGDKNLGINFQLGSEGKPIFLSAVNNEDSQNDFVYKQLKHEILGVAKILNDNDLLMSDGQLYDGATLSELRFRKLKEILGESDYQQGYIDRFGSLCTKLITVEEELTKLSEKDDPYKRSAEYTSKLNQLNKQKEEVLNTLNAFKSGENAIDYMGKTLFCMDPELNKDWFVGNMTNWLKLRKGISLLEFSNLTDIEQTALTQEWEKESKNLAYTQEEAWEAYKYFGEQIQPELTQAQKQMQAFKESAKILQELNDPETSPLNNVEYVNASMFSEDAEDPTFLIDYETDRLIKEDGTLESVANLAGRLIQPGESTSDFEKRKQGIIEKLKKQHAANLNRQRGIEALQKARDIIVRSGNILDKTTQRELLLRMSVTQKDIIDDQTGRIYRFDKLIPELSDKVMEIMGKVRKLEDLSTAQADVLTLASKQTSENFRRDLSKKFDIIKRINRDILEEYDEFVNVDSVINFLNTSISMLKLQKGFFSVIPELITPDNKIDLSKFKELYKQELINTGLDEAEADSKLSDIHAYFADKANSTEIKTILTTLGLNNDIRSILANKKQFDKINKYSECGDVRIESDLTKEFIKEMLNHSGASAAFLQYDGSGQLDTALISDSINFLGEDSMSNYIEAIEPDEDEDGYFTLWDAAIPTSAELDKRQNQTKQKIENKFQSLEAGIRNDALFSVIEDIRNVHVIDNPISGIVKKLALVMHRDVEGIEQVLQLLQDNMLNDKKENFTLSPQQRETLEEARDLLKLAKSYLYSTWDSADLLNPFPHNQFINEVIQENDLKMEKMPVIDNEVAKLYDQEINHLIDEIGELDSKGNYTAGSWLRWDQLHALNKPKQFIESEDALYTAHINFFINNKTFFTGTVKDASNKDYSFDILDGMDSAISEPNPVVAQYKLEVLIYNNLKKIKAETGKSFTDILHSIELSQILKNKQDALQNQTVSNLDANIKGGNLTPMDIGIYLATIVSIDPTKANQYFQQSKALPEGRVPLGIQQYLAKVGIAYSENKKDFTEVMTWIYNLVKYDKGAIHYMDGIFISGNGGAGKTDIVLRYINDYLLTIKGSSQANIYVCAPKEAQRKNMQSITKGKSKNPEELCELLLGKATYSDLKAKAKELKEYPNLITLKPNFYGTPIAVCDEAIKFEKVNIDAIILDEGTHFDTFTLSIFSAYAKQNNIPFIILGDNLQQGYKKENTECNLNQERVFIPRTSRLAVTLRDSNFQKQTNNNELAYITQQLNDSPNNPTERIQYLEDAFSHLSKIKLFSYQGTEINGDSLVDDIDDIYAEKLKSIILPNGETKKAVIGYVGPKDSKYNTLKNILGDQLSEPIEEVDIQGQEFDHVIVNVSWSDFNYTQYTDNDDKARYALKFLRRLYTLSTRGKVSTTFVNNNNLDQLVQFETQNYKNSITNFTDETKAALVKHFEENLSQLELPTTPLPTHSVGGSASYGEEDEINFNFDDIFTETGDIQKDDFVALNTEAPNADPTEQSLQALDTATDDKLRTQAYINKQLSGFGRAYGDASMLGVPRTVVGVDKKGNNIYAWDFSRIEHADIKEDIGIFYSPSLGSSISDGKVKNVLIKKLLALKCVYLYNIQPKSEQSNNIYNTYFQDIFSKDDFDNLIKNTKFRVVVSHVNEDKHNFIGNTGLSLDKAEINGDGENDALVYRIVADFSINGQKHRLTLGMLSDPNTYANNKDFIISNINRVIDDQVNSEEITSAQGEKAKETYAKQVEQNITNYKKALQDLRTRWHALNDKTAELVMNIDSADGTSPVVFDGNTVLRTKEYKKYIDEVADVQKIRLDHFGINPKKAQFTDFERANSYTVVSQVYLYKHNSESKFNTLPGLSGKPVVFVSNNISLSPDDLLRTWISERESPTHSVRMVRLDNAGVTMSDLCNAHFSEFFSTESSNGNQNKLPVETKRLAIRQLVALHNFRANIIAFQKAFENYNGLNKDQEEYFLKFDNLDDLLQELHNQYQIYSESHKDDKSETGFREWFRNEGDKTKVSLDFAENVWAFNDSLDEAHVRQFRLGTGNINSGEATGGIPHKNHWQIRNMNLPKKSATYQGTNDDTRNGIYLDKEGMDQMYKVINGIFEIISDLNIKLYSVQCDKFGNEISESKHFYSNTTFIDPVAEYSVSGQRGIIRSLTSFDEDNYTWGIEDASGNTFSPRNVSRWTRLLPSILMKIATRAQAYAKTQIYTDGKDKGKRYLPAKVSGEDEKRVDRLWDWNASGKIVLKEYEGTGEDRKVKQKIELTGLKDLIEEHGENIPRILDLCFHGTSNTKGLIDSQIYGFIKTSSGEVKHTVTPQCTDAIFKYGFFIDPMADIGAFKEGRGEAHNTNEGLFVKCQTNLSLFLVRSQVDNPTFSFNLSFSEITNEEESPSIKPTKSKEDILQESSASDQIAIIKTADLNEYPKLQTLLKTLGITSLGDVNITQFNDYIKLETLDKVYTIDIANNKLIETGVLSSPTFPIESTETAARKQFSEKVFNSITKKGTNGLKDLKERLLDLFFDETRESPSYYTRCKEAINSGKSDEEISAEIAEITNEYFNEIDNNRGANQSFEDVTDDDLDEDIDKALNNINKQTFCI